MSSLICDIHLKKEIKYRLLLWISFWAYIIKAWTEFSHCYSVDVYGEDFCFVFAKALLSRFLEFWRKSVSSNESSSLADGPIIITTYVYALLPISLKSHEIYLIFISTLFCFVFLPHALSATNPQKFLSLTQISSLFWSSL